MPDDLELLTGPGARDLLAAVLAPAGEDLLSWRLRQVDHRPGRGTTAAYDARVRSADGERTRLLGAGTGLPSAATVVGRLRWSDGRQEATVWCFPLDPALPGLPTATDERAVRALLDAHGVEPGPVELRVRTYRPGRRAVVEVRTPATRLFVKVLPAHEAASLHDRHVLLRAAGLPVPRSLGRSEDGVVLLEALPGTSLRARLREDTAPDLDGTAVLALLDALPAQLLALPARPAWCDRVTHYAAVTAAALPDEAERCSRLAGRVLAAAVDRDLDEPVHGDLYETSLLLDGDRISGLLDVDTAGPGRRADDLACLLGHLSVLAQLQPAHAAGTRALAERWLAAFDAAADPADLRARVAGVVVSLATGPARVRSRGWQDLTRARLDLAESWLERAERSARGPVGRR